MPFAFASEAYPPAFPTAPVLCDAFPGALGPAAFHASGGASLDETLSGMIEVSLGSHQKAKRLQVQPLYRVQLQHAAAIRCYYIEGLFFTSHWTGSLGAFTASPTQSWHFSVRSSAKLQRALLRQRPRSSPLGTCFIYFSSSPIQPKSDGLQPSRISSSWCNPRAVLANCC